MHALSPTKILSNDNEILCFWILYNSLQLILAVEFVIDHSKCWHIYVYITEYHQLIKILPFIRILIDSYLKGWKLTSESLCTKTSDRSRISSTHCQDDLCEIEALIPGRLKRKKIYKTRARKTFNNHLYKHYQFKVYFAIPDCL